MRHGICGNVVRVRLAENKNVDVCAVLTGSADAGAYWRKLKQRLREEGSEVVTFCHGLKLTAPDGKLRETDCANTEDIFRIIQSIPSPKAEPFKRWPDILLKSTAGIAGSNSWGEAVYQCPSLNQEAPSVRAG